MDNQDTIDGVFSAVITLLNQIKNKSKGGVMLAVANLEILSNEYPQDYQATIDILEMSDATWKSILSENPPKNEGENT